MSALQKWLAVLIGWLDRREREALAYLIEENRILRAQLGGRRPRLTDDDRRVQHQVGRSTIARTLKAHGRVQILGSTAHPDEAFMRQVGRTLTMADGETCRVLICDRDTKWSGPVRQILQEAGIRIVQTPYQAPNANAYAERFVRSIKEECLNRIIPIGERHFRRAVREYVTHYHFERNHQGLGNTLIAGTPVRVGRAIRRRPRMGGLHNYYERAA